MRWICTGAHARLNHHHLSSLISRLISYFHSLSARNVKLWRRREDCYPISAGLLTSFPATHHTAHPFLSSQPLPPLPLGLFKDTVYPVPSCLCLPLILSPPPPPPPQLPSLSLLYSCFSPHLCHAFSSPSISPYFPLILFFCVFAVTMQTQRM